MANASSFPIIGIGASAGGLEPLETLFDNVNPNAGYAYVVVQHLAPNHKSLMDELLARHTTLPIQVVEAGMKIEPNHIYLNPPKKFVLVNNDHFELSDKEDKKLSYPITTFLNSLAEAWQENTAAIILSGTGSDGAEGIKFIKEKGGFVLVQDPDTAKFDGMPKNAIHSGAADKICHVEQFPTELETFFASNRLIQPEQLQSIEYKKQIERIINLVKSQTNIDFTGYKFSTVYRRTVRRMGIVGYPSLEEYYDYLKTSNNEGLLLGKELLIGVTRFFRDTDVFTAIQTHVIPKIVEKASETRSLRVWVPACSTGEEAYSLAMLIKDHLKSQRLQYDVTIFATDLDKQAIENAANRTFPQSIAHEVPAHFLTNYFIPQNKGFRIAKEIREMIVFSAHNLIQDPPFSKIDLLSCRNFLIYLNPDVQQRLFALFQYTLKADGFLVLGSSESMGEMSDQFEEFDKKHKIFTNKYQRKVLQPQVRGPRKNTANLTSGRSAENYSERFSPQSPQRTLNQIQQFLITEFVPDTLVFSDDLELMHTTGKMNRWLRLPQGEISTNVVKMLPNHISLAFEVAAGKVITTGEPMSVKNLEMTPDLREVYNGTHLHVHIKKLETNIGYDLFAASFETVRKEKTDETIAVIDMGQASKAKINILERELIVNKENLQSTVEELESSNEELQAANEELQSSNEELESVNEELYTVNAEYQKKAEELSNAHNDLNNLIQSTEIAILFLDVDLNIRRFTPAIKSILNLMPQDVGRHISHFRTRFQLENFMDKIEEVHESLRPFETTISDLNERQFMMRITPFRTSKNEIHGVVLSFIDVTTITSARKDLALSEKALDDLKTHDAKSSELYELIANNATDMVCLHHLDGKLQYISPSAFDISGYKPDELKDKALTDFVDSKKHRDTWKDAVSKIVSGHNTGLIIYPFTCKDKGIRWFETRLRNVTDPHGKVTRLLTTTKDVTQRIQYEEELNRLSLIARQTNNAVIITDTDGKITFVNEAFEVMTGYAETEVLGEKPGDFLQGEETDPESVKTMRTAMQNNKGFNVDVVNYTKKGHKYWTRIQCELMLDAEENHNGFFSLQYDITQEKEYQSHIDALNGKLQQQNSKLAEMNKSLEEFAYIASHDLKAPVRNIIGVMQLMGKKELKPGDKEYDEYNEMIITAAREMNRLIESLLEYSRSGTVNETVTEVKLENVVEEVKLVFSDDLARSEGEIEFESNGRTAMVYPILFKRLLQNLVSNAIKYRGHNPPEININCQFRKDQLHISISDNGIGISPDQFENIFKIFSSIEPNQDSNGIGLAVCKKITELHGGTIKVDSQPGSGSTFEIVLPQ